tara:strand:- start:2151 stop:2963 length:813 start_codon:yes stop_codon:yes gene_type:complete
MSPDECFTAMACALDIHEDMGYMAILEEVKELKDQHDYLEGETDRLGELETIAWIDFYGEKEVVDDIKAYRFRIDIVDMKEDNKKLKVKYESMCSEQAESDCAKYIKELQEENNKLKAELAEQKADRDKYFGYLKDKDLECEEQRETANALREELAEQSEDVGDLVDDIIKHSPLHDIMKESSAETVDEFVQDTRDNWVEIQNLQGYKKGYERLQRDYKPLNKYTKELQYILALEKKHHSETRNKLTTERAKINDLLTKCKDIMESGESM